MPRYIIERNVGTITDAELEASSRRSVEVLEEMEGIVWIRSYASHSEGKVYCEYEAPSIEAVREHARRAGLPADKISEIDLELSPTMFV
ncbi:MAG: DUF4242 domain-containing protein [Longimicrobiales bacterium]|nr:DUF4242 domain-containing protein [Longimicrobiales bacterium]